MVTLHWRTPITSGQINRRHRDLGFWYRSFILYESFLNTDVITYLRGTVSLSLKVTDKVVITRLPPTDGDQRLGRKRIVSAMNRRRDFHKVRIDVTRSGDRLPS